MTLADGVMQSRPRALTPGEALSGTLLTPGQRIRVLDPSTWEDVVQEWVRLIGPQYVRVTRLGGANDHGVDVAGFNTDSGFEGDWHCFQCKHYASPISPSVAFEEMLKIFEGVVGRHFVLPSKYRFVAPRGASTTLQMQLNAPSVLKQAFIDYVNNAKGYAAGLRKENPELVLKILRVAEDVDFAIFNVEEIDEFVRVLRNSPYFVQWFGGGLPARPPADAPPSNMASHEARYISHLVEVYKEVDSSIETIDAAFAHAVLGEHMRRQRVAFYSAESLRVFARDSVPPGTFESLQDDFYEGLIETHQAQFQRGYDRLSAVLAAALSLQVSANALINVTDSLDRRGICHQLANDDRLRWCGEIV
jgi:hypothetical protein